jgi:hypothetical protein
MGSKVYTVSDSSLASPSAPRIGRLLRRRISTRRLKYYSMLADVTINVDLQVMPDILTPFFQDNAAESADRFSGAELSITRKIEIRRHCMTTV